MEREFHLQGGLVVLFYFYDKRALRSHAENQSALALNDTSVRRSPLPNDAIENAQSICRDITLGEGPAIQTATALVGRFFKPFMYCY